jgi:hypothetical protein
MWMSMIGRVVAASDEPHGIELKVRDEHGDVLVVYKSDIIPNLKQEMLVSGFFSGADHRNLRAVPLTAIDLSWLDPDNSTIVVSQDPVVTAPKPTDEAGVSGAVVSDKAVEAPAAASERELRDREVSLLIGTINETGSERAALVCEDQSLFRPAFVQFGALGRLELYPSDIERDMIALSLSAGLKKSEVSFGRGTVIALDALCEQLDSSQR